MTQMETAFGIVQLFLGGSSSAAVAERKEQEEWVGPQPPGHGCPTTTTAISNQPINIINSSSARSSYKCNNKLASGGAPSKKPRVQQGATVAGAASSSAASQSISFKVRKEKLGDRITALHQLVSPFGKTDTASVLLETIGYVRFLQSQIEALSLPYLATATPESHQQSMVLSSEESKKDLKSKGLCLVPISSMLHVGVDDNGEDYWAAATIGGVFR
ncbi:unnamed protein product [Cuscuta campestris]|uniref:BHLH domain-containing protein n=1 Tax=Cuscuta campestris TaxID=132261 RepID=A0A484KYW3_9ASTE|nr:unnamed protein product [Cuscuta campestris]